MADSPDAIILEVPAHPRHLRHVRLCASTVAADLGMDVEAIEDLRVGVNELFGLLLDGLDPDTRVRIVCTPEPGGLTIEGTAEHVDSSIPEADQLAAEILRVVVDEHQLTGDGRVRSARLRKQLAPVGA